VNIVSVPYGDYSISPGGALQNGIQVGLVPRAATSTLLSGTGDKGY